MKIGEIAEKYDINIFDFEDFLSRHPQYFKKSFLNKSVDDADIPQVMELYKADLAKRTAIEQADAEVAEKEKQEKNKRKKAETEAALIEELEKIRKAKERSQALASMLITSGFSFDGYKVVKYSGYISGDDATQIPRSGIFGGNNGKNLTDALVKIRIQAIKELKEAAYDLGCNAVIGVDFDYITLEPETVNLSGGTLYEPYIICVTANGNAVVIEKD